MYISTYFFSSILLARKIYFFCFVFFFFFCCCCLFFFLKKREKTARPSQRGSNPALHQGMQYLACMHARTCIHPRHAAFSLPFFLSSFSSLSPHVLLSFLSSLSPSASLSFLNSLFLSLPHVSPSLSFFLQDRSFLPASSLLP